MTEKMNEELENEVFKVTQKFLKNPPLIIWGSGATIPFGLPSMQNLNEELKNKIDGFNSTNNNLEIELKKDRYKQKMPLIKKTIWNKINIADIKVLNKMISNDTNDFNGIESLIKKFHNAHPKTVNIVTTNYDRVLEYVLSYYNYPFTDGFNGRTLSNFDEKLFKIKNMVNLIKVHGSLNWFEVGDETRFFPEIVMDKIPKIIAPGKNKYEETRFSPYRELVNESDNLIKSAPSFLVVGFGFNDAHLTPKIKEKIKNETPIVLITKNITRNSFQELANAKEYIFFEESRSNKTKITYKKKSMLDKREVELDGNFWQLNNFMDIL